MSEEFERELKRRMELTKKFRLDVKKYVKPEDCVLIIIDMENDALNPLGGLAFWRLRDCCDELGTFQNIKKLIGVCRKVKIPIFWMKFAFEKGYSDVPRGIGSYFEELVLRHWAETMKGKEPFLMKGTWGIETIDELKGLMKPEDIEIVRSDTSAFEGTHIEKYLHRFKRHTLIVTGVNTDCCVESTVRDARDKGYLAIVPGDACGTISVERHHQALERFMVPWFFAQVTTTDELINALKRGK